MTKNVIGILSLILLCTVWYQNQSNEEVTSPVDERPYSIKEDPYDSANNYYRYKKELRQNGYAKQAAPEQYALIERARRTPGDRSAPEYGENYKLEELTKARASKYRSAKSADLDFIERGPGNVAGRTRALLVLQSDPDLQTWLAGSASGGIWKTTDGGRNWTDKTPDLPNLGTNTLAMSTSDPDVIYAGTGEHFTRDIDGVGMFKSTDEGESWTQIVKPGDYDAFRNVSRIAVDPDDADIVIATTRNSVFEDSLRAAIYKSIDGGTSWELKRLSTEERYDDIAVNSLNFNTIYVAVNRQGVLKSTDGGETWADRSRGLQINGRIEIETSPLDTNIVWGSAQAGARQGESHLYQSLDGGNIWKLAVEENGDAVNFLGGQGWYDNVITAHPFEKNTAYVGGVNLFKVDVTRGDQIDLIYDIVDQGALSFLDFVNGTRVGGGIFEGNVDPEEVVSIQLRFSQSQQKAHRFTVNKQGSGVPADQYTYAGVVDIPFEAWDVTNDRQLMVSFRDQGEDGGWTLKNRTLDASNTAADSREYIFVHDVTYQDIEYDSIAMNGGHEHRLQKFFWPVLKTGTLFDPTSPFEQSFTVEVETLLGQAANTAVISDAYGEFNGNNSFTGAEFANNLGQHPDQHNLVPIVIDSAAGIFSLISTNDGGVYVTHPSRDPGTTDGSFRYAGFGYNTTQFYGADKMPGEDRYIGGMQDNSTWFTPSGQDGGADVFYEFAFGGDGFEAIWNNRDPDLIIGSVQFNSFRRSTDGGRTWRGATSGISDGGPFVSRLANSRALPDRIFTVGGSGVWVSTDFGASWTGTPIEDMWSFSNSADIEVSTANRDVIWAGGSLDESRRLFVSNDGGATFKPTSYYQATEMGTVSGIGVHPTDAQTAYALFSFARRPKVLKTTDQGQTWVDISGFEGNGGTSASTNGFPDVAVNCLLVFPNDTSQIWVGSEIGIIESLDAGSTWHLLEANMPAVNVQDMKIQDDEIVIATYGRGIWSVAVPEIERTYFFPPVINSVAVHPDGSIVTAATLSSQFDSLLFAAEGLSSDLIINEVSVGQLNVGLSVMGIIDGTYDFKLTGYSEGLPYESLPFSASLFRPGIPTETYFNDFSIDSLLDDFVGNGFSIRLENGFDDLALHSDHNYANEVELTYQLKTPIIVAENQIFTYRDVAIIETGEDFSEFGDRDFYDFVTIEGSDDGITWRPLFDGYDSSFNPDWEFTYDSGGTGDATLFVNHREDLKEAFDIGDVIFIRFRLVADPGLNAWGWAIDDLNIGRLTPVFDPRFEELKIFPNPVDDMLQLTIPNNTGHLNIIITDVQGRSIYRSGSISSSSDIQIPMSDYSEGIYFIQVLDEGILIASEKLVVVR